MIMMTMKKKPNNLGFQFNQSIYISVDGCTVSLIVIAESLVG